jgi:hypothetical protein
MPYWDWSKGKRRDLSTGELNVDLNIHMQTRKIFRIRPSLTAMLKAASVDLGASPTTGRFPTVL